MSVYAKYRNKIQAVGLNLKERYIRDEQEILIKEFDSLQNYETGKINNIDMEFQIIDDNSLSLAKSTAQKIIIVKPFETINIGDLVEWKGDIWMCLKQDDNNIYQSGIIQKCNLSLKWKNEFNLISKMPCVKLKIGKYTEGIDDDQFMSLIDDNITLVVKKTQDTLKFKPNNQRFILGKSTVFRLIRVDDFTSDGLLYLTLKVDQKSNNKDNFELGIADYYDESVLEIDILNKNLSMKIGETSTIKYNVLRNNDIFKADVIFESLDENIATIDDNGIIIAVANGITEIKASLTENSDISTVFEVEVAENPTSIEEPTLLGCDIIKLTQSKEYIIENAKSVVYDFTVNNSLVEIEKISENRVKLIGLKEGDIVLKATSPGNTLIKNIKIISFWG